MSAAKLRYSEGFQRLRDFFLATGSARSVIDGRTGLVDDIVRDAFAQVLAPSFPSGLALLAVGGYGRRDLFPHSDIDLLLLVERAEQSKEAREAFSAFFRSLWDAGLRISHSTRTPQECCEIHQRNIELNISLLDQRLLAGDEEIYRRLAAKLPGFLKSQRQSLDAHLCQLARARHARFQDSIYHMEPDIKETPGGFRDLHLLCWMSGSGNGPALDAAREFLSLLRCLLHYESNRDANLLTFELQDRVAARPIVNVETPEEYMRQYFRHSRVVHSAALKRLDAAEASRSSLLGQFRDWRSRLSNADFSIYKERVYFKNPREVQGSPELAFRLFQFLARHGLRLAADAETRLLEASPFFAGYFARSRPLWPSLQPVLELPHAALALRAMEDTGFLQALFPEWRDIESLVVRDYYHRYTVDEHTLRALHALAELSASRDPARQRFRDLLAETQRISLLRFALVFHDIGKGAHTGSHAVESLRLADVAMERIEMPREDRATVRFLIDKHLELSSLMTSRDLEDPATAKRVAEVTGTLEHLKLLTLLTYADVSAVNPTAMTPWRLEQLWRVYRVGLREHTRALEDDRIDDTKLAVSEFLAGFPVRYLRTHTETEVQNHIQLARRFRAVGVAVDLTRSAAGWSLTVIARDRTFLFASISGVLSSAGMNILQAEAFANRHGEVLDTFVFADPVRTLELNPEEVNVLRETAQKAALGQLDIKKLLSRRPKPIRPSNGFQIRPSVAVHPDLSDSATLIEVIAEDRPGLLYDLTSTISGVGCNIEVVLIHTEAQKALDTFYVTVNGAKLAAPLADDLRQRLLAACAPLI